MPKLPVLKPREVVRLLINQGFVEVRQRGSHKQFRHADGRATTVPFHSGRDISPSLLRVIARDIGMSAEVLLGINDSLGLDRLPDPHDSEETNDLPESGHDLCEP